MAENMIPESEANGRLQVIMDSHSRELRKLRERIEYLENALRRVRDLSTALSDNKPVRRLEGGE